MNRNSPDYYVERSVSDSIKETLALIAYIRSLPPPRLVEPVLTPRFAIACTDDLLNQLGDIARADPSLPIQTHISENKEEVKRTLNLFPTATCYADVYDSHGLLGPRTILGHAIHVEEKDIVLIKKRNAGVSHCPTSNFNLRSGVCLVGELIDRGIKVIDSILFACVSLTGHPLLGRYHRSASARMSRAVSLPPFSPRSNTPPLRLRFWPCNPMIHPLHPHPHQHMKVVSFLSRRYCISQHSAARKFAVWKTA